MLQVSWTKIGNGDEKGGLRMLKYLIVILFGVLLTFGSIANGKTLFSDDFEGDTIGDPPKNFDKYEGEGPHNRADFIMEVMEDPHGESDKVVHTYSTGLLLPKAEGRDDWTNWVWEWDWMWADLGYGGTAFRLTDDDYYHMSPRKDNVNVGFWIWQGAWEQIGDLAEYGFELDTWCRFQLTADGDTFTLKIKKRDDPTPFAKLKPILDMQDGTLEKGPMGVYGWNLGDAWMDNFIVGETEADMLFAVKPVAKLTAMWGAVKSQN